MSDTECTIVPSGQLSDAVVVTLSWLDSVTAKVVTPASEDRPVKTTARAERKRP